jgi:hypothetical protein
VLGDEKKDQGEHKAAWIRLDFNSQNDQCFGLTLPARLGLGRKKSRLSGGRIGFPSLSIIRSVHGEA